MTRALVTGGSSGIGAAIVARLRAEGVEVEVLDLVTGFDVAEPAAWERVGPVEIACLNAGVLGGPRACRLAFPRGLDDEPVPAPPLS